MMTEAWSSRAAASGKGRGHVAELFHGERLILSAQAATSRQAVALAHAWLDQARAGLVPPVPQAERLAQLAAAPLRRPGEAQDFDLSPLPLWSDARNQRELF